MIHTTAIKRGQLRDGTASTEANVTSGSAPTVAAMSTSHVTETTSPQITTTAQHETTAAVTSTHVSSEAPTTATITTTTTGPTTLHVTETVAPTTTRKMVTIPPFSGNMTIKFRKATLTLGYYSKCSFQTKGFACSDDGDNRIVDPISLDSSFSFVRNENVDVFVSTARIALALNNSASNVVAPFLTVNGTLTLDGNLTIVFQSEPEVDKKLTFLVFQAKEFAGSMIYNGEIPTNLWSFLNCFSVRTGWYTRGSADGKSKLLFVEAVVVDDCLQNVKDHPVRAALISIGTIGLVFTAFALLIMWRKRRFDQQRRTMLASRIDLDK